MRTLTVTSRPLNTWTRLAEVLGIGDRVADLPGQPWADVEQPGDRIATAVRQPESIGAVRLYSW